MIVGGGRGGRPRARRTGVLSVLIALTGAAVVAAGAPAVGMTAVLPTAVLPTAVHPTAVLPTAVLPTAVDHTEGLRVESSSTYTVDLAASVIHVEQVIHLTNEVPDRVTQSYIEQFYFPEYATLVLPGATNVSASWDGGAPLRATVAPAEGALASVATIDLAPDLYYGASKTVRLTYDLRHAVGYGLRRVIGIGKSDYVAGCDFRRRNVFCKNQ